MPRSRIRPSWGLSTAVALAVFTAHSNEVAAEADGSKRRNEVRALLPHYDPAIRENYLAAQAKVPADSASKSASGADSSNSSQPVVSLPRIIVRPNQSNPTLPAKPLPRLRVQAPVKDIPPDEFLTPEANTARLVEKHLSRFDRFFLNRFTLPLFGKSKESRAHEAEAIESAAVQLNTIVDLLETEGSEPRDPEEQKKLKDLYYDTYVSRPK